MNPHRQASGIKYVLESVASILTPKDPTGSSLNEFCSWLIKQSGFDMSKLNDAPWIKSKYGYWKTSRRREAPSALRVAWRYQAG